MPIYHLHVKNISRAFGRSAVACAAYRAGETLFNEAEERESHFGGRRDVVHAEIRLPDGAPDWMFDRAALWNAVEAREKRKDARLAKELEFSLPRELSDEDWLTVAREMADAYTSQGFGVDLAIHEDGRRHNPHAHLMLTTRHIGPDGLGAKIREADSTRFVLAARALWAKIANAALGKAGSGVTIDARSNRQRGLDRSPGKHRGPDAEERQQARNEAAALKEEPLIGRDDSEALKRLMQDGGFVDRFATVLARPEFPFESREASLAADEPQVAAMWAAVDDELQRAASEREIEPSTELARSLREQLHADRREGRDTSRLERALASVERLKGELATLDELRRENELLKARAHALAWKEERDLPALEPFGELVRTGEVQDAQLRSIGELEGAEPPPQQGAGREAARATADRINGTDIPDGRVAPGDDAGLNWARAYAESRANSVPDTKPKPKDRDRTRER